MRESLRPYEPISNRRGTLNVLEFQLLNCLGPPRRIQLTHVHDIPSLPLPPQVFLYSTRVATPLTDFASDPAAGFGSPVYTRLPEVIERKDSLRAQQSQVGPARPLHVPGLTRTTSEARVESMPRGSGRGGDGRGGGGVRRRQGCAEHDDDDSLCLKRIF